MCALYWLILNDGEPGEVYNVGSGQAISIRHILDNLLSLAKTPITLEADPDRMRPSDTPIFVSDSSRLIQATGWQPQIPLEQTLYDILAYWRRKHGRIKIYATGNVLKTGLALSSNPSFNEE